MFVTFKKCIKKFYKILHGFFIILFIFGFGKYRKPYSRERNIFYEYVLKSKKVSKKYEHIISKIGLMQILVKFIHFK